MIKLRTRSKYCSRCSQVKELGTQAYCRACASAYNTQWRKKHPLKEHELAKARTRSKTRYYVKRDNIKKLPCRVCGTTERLEAHHPDYNDYQKVVWLCRLCHRELHLEMTYNKFRWKQLKFDL